MIKLLAVVSIFILPLLLYAGGKPSRGTPKDKRLKDNKPGTAVPKTKPAVLPQTKSAK